LLTNIMLYVMTDSFESSIWLYTGTELEKAKRLPEGCRVEIPTGYCAWRDPRHPAVPRSLVEKGYNLVHWSEQPSGGHFAATEEPRLFIADLRAWATLLE
jgi:hypothetical protein